MRSVDMRRRFLRRSVVGTEDSGGDSFIVIGDKRPFLRGRYTVLIDMQSKGLRGTTGSYRDVYLALRVNAKEGTALLKECARAIKDKEHDIRDGYNAIEVGCLAALVDGHMDEVSVASSVKEARSTVSLVLGGLASMGLVERICTVGNGADDRAVYGLTRAGKKEAVLLLDDGDFQKVRESIKGSARMESLSAASGWR